MKKSFEAWKHDILLLMNVCEAARKTDWIISYTEPGGEEEQIMRGELDRESPRAGIYSFAYTDASGAPQVTSCEQRANAEPALAGPAGLHVLEERVWAATLSKVREECDRAQYKYKELDDLCTTLQRENRTLRARETEGGLFDEATVGLIVQLSEKWFGTQDLKVAVAALVQKIDDDETIRNRLLTIAPGLLLLLGKALNGDDENGDALATTSAA